MASVNGLSDNEIRTQLNKLGYPVGPITGTTRKVLLKKLKHLLESSKSNANDKTQSKLSRFSSGDESEDEAKPQTRKSMPPPKKTPPLKTTRRRSTGRTIDNYEPPAEVTSSPNSEISSQVSLGNGLANASPEERDFSFSNNYLRSRTSSLYSSVSGRRSYRSDLNTSGNSTLNAYAVGSDSDSNELESLGGKTRFGKIDSSLGLSTFTGLTTSYTPADNLNFRPNSNKLSLNNDSSKLGSDGNDNSYSSDFSRRLNRNIQHHTYVNRIGNNTLSPTLGLANVKESDDEEESSEERMLRNSVSPSQSSSRSRNDRWSFDSPWWKNTTIVSMGLLAVFVCFFALIFVSYINVKRKDAPISTPDTNFPVCRGVYNKAGVNCIVEDDIHTTMEMFRKIYQELHDHAVKVKCDESSKTTALSWVHLNNLIVEKTMDMSIWHVENQQGNLKVLINANPQWGILITKDGLDLTEPSLPFSCQIKYNVISFLWMLVRIVFACVLLYILKLGINWWMYRKEAHKKEVNRLVEAIIDMLQTHSQNSGNRDTFLAVDHVHDQLVEPKQRRNPNMMKLWDDAVASLQTNESRVRREVQKVAGESCQVWRWLPTNSRRKMWQGQAFETQEGSVNSFNVSPTPCLKIRHMFDPDVEVGDVWVTNVEDAILEKCEGINVLHIAVDNHSTEGCVYLKCSSHEEAGKAFRALHGSWFDSKLVTVKYLRLGRYHERFPDALRCSKPLRPSNNHKMSLQ